MIWSRKIERDWLTSVCIINFRERERERGILKIIDTTKKTK